MKEITMKYHFMLSALLSHAADSPLKRWENTPVYYFVRGILTDGHLAWSSPVFFEKV